MELMIGPKYKYSGWPIFFQSLQWCVSVNFPYTVETKAMKPTLYCIVYKEKSKPNSGSFYFMCHGEMKNMHTV